jgi:hypothetical protein
MPVSSVTVADTFEALMPFVVPIFGPTSGDRPEGVGSGVLLRISDDTLLLTAAHVLDEVEPAGTKLGRALYLPSGRDLCELELTPDRLLRSEPPEGGRKLDDRDVGAVRLPNILVKALLQGKYQALVPANLQLTETDRSSDRAIYGFMGYPSSQQRRRPDRKTIRRTCFSYSGEPLAPGQVPKGLQPEVHIVLPFDEKRKGAPRLSGMSGGAVWSLRGHLRQGPRLAGIGIEDRKKQGILVGVRIKFFVAAVAERFPELAVALPPIRDVAATLR